MSDRERKDIEDEIRCLTNAENYCCERAAMALGDKSRDVWRRNADWNALKRAEREAILAAAA